MKLTVEETGAEIEISEHEARQAHRALQHRLLELRRAAGYANIVENYFDVMALVDCGGHVVLVDPLRLCERLGVRRGGVASQEL
jgi:hypothetical protein